MADMAHFSSGPPVPAPASAPAPGAVQMGFPMGREAEESLNMSTAGLSAEEFVFRSLPGNDSVDHGIFLPAPAKVSFDVLVPKDAELVFDASLLKPAVPAVLKSDGAKLFVEVERGSRLETVAEIALKPNAEQPVRVDLRLRWEAG